MERGTARPRAASGRRSSCSIAGLLVGLTVAAMGCTASPRPTGEWVKTRASADDLEGAREACKQEAMADIAATANQPVAAPAGAGSFFRCMSKKGWVQGAKPTPASGQ